MVFNMGSKRLFLRFKKPPENTFPGEHVPQRWFSEENCNPR